MGTLKFLIMMMLLIDAANDCCAKMMMVLQLKGNCYRLRLRRRKLR